MTWQRERARDGEVRVPDRGAARRVPPFRSRRIARPRRHAVHLGRAGQVLRVADTVGIPALRVHDGADAPSLERDPASWHVPRRRRDEVVRRVRRRVRVIELRVGAVLGNLPVIQPILGVGERIRERDQQRIGPLLEAEADALVPRPPFVREDLDAPESIWSRPDWPCQVGLCGGPQHAAAAGDDLGLRDRRRIVGVEEAVLVAAVHVEIDGCARARAELPLQAETVLPRELVLEVGRDLLDVARREHGARREAGQRIREDRKCRIGRRQRERHDAVPAQDRALDDGEDRVLLREPPGAAAHRPAAIAARIPIEADARIEVVLVDRGGPVRDVVHDLDVVAKTVVERQVVGDAPVVLHEAAEDPRLRVDDILAGHERERLREQIRRRCDRRSTGKVVDAILIGQVALRRHVVGDPAPDLE